MVIIDGYSGCWQRALNPSSPRCGTLVRMPITDPDAMEWDDFRRCLVDDGKSLEWVRGNRRSDFYRVVRVSNDSRD